MATTEPEHKIRSANDIIWQNGDLAITDFFDNFRRFLPLIVKVTEGYHGPDDLHIISGGDVYRIFGISRQSRMMVRDRSTGKNYSIPMKYPRKFLVQPRKGPHKSTMNRKFTAGSKQAYLLEDIKGDLNYPDVNMSLILADQSVPLHHGTQKQDFISFGELEPMDVYDENYLVGNSVIQGSLHPKVITIPLYMSIKVSTGINACPELGGLDQWALFQTICDEEHFKISARAVVKTNTEIMEFHEDDIKDDHQYEFINPKGFIYEKLVEPGGQTPSYSKPKQGSGSEYYVNVAEGDIGNDYVDLTYADNKLYAGDYDALPYLEYEKVRNLKQSFRHEREMKKTNEAKQNMKDATSAPPVPQRIKNNRTTPVRHGCPSGNNVCENVANQPLQPKPGAKTRIAPVNPTTGSRRPVPEIPPAGAAVPEIPGRAVPEKHAASQRHLPDTPAHSIPEKPLAARKPASKDKTKPTYLPDNKLTSFSDVPEDLTKLTVNQVLDVLKLLKLDKYADKFDEMGPVDGQFLCEMDMSMLREDIGMGGMEAKKLWKFVQEGWRPNT